MNTAPDQKSVERFHLLLKKMFPVEEFHAHDLGICWQFFRPSPEIDRRFMQILDSIPGPPYWSLSAWREGACLSPQNRRRLPVAPAGNGEVASDSKEASTMFALADSAVNGWRTGLALPEQLDWSGLDNLISVIERDLHLEHAAPQDFGPHLWALDNRKNEKEFQDFVEPGYQEIWLAKHPEAEAESYTWPLENSFPLSFGLRYEEWKSIFIEDLGSTPVKTNDGVPYAVENEFDEYPLLSRLKNINETALYRSEEIADFKEECLAVAQVASQTSLRGLDKLIVAANWADHLRYGIIFIDLE